MNYVSNLDFEVDVRVVVSYQTGNVDSRFAILGRSLQASSHGKVFVNRVETILGISLGNYLLGGFVSDHKKEVRREQKVKKLRKQTYTKELDVVKDLVVESKVIAGNEINAGVLLDLPVLETKSLALVEELITRELASPVCFSGLLQVSKTPHTGETEDRSESLISILSQLRGVSKVGLRLNHFHNVYSST